MFVLEPYADVDDIIIKADNVMIKDDRLIIDGITFTKPIAYQIIDGIKHYIDVKYILKEQGYGFELGNYDDSYEVIIDPLIDLESSSYLGGSDDKITSAIAIDSNGNVFVTGGTYSNDFSIVNGYGNTLNGVIDGFVKFDFGINIPLDIKPGSCPNPLNVNSNGVIPVAIVGTDNFVTQVDISTIRVEVSTIRSSLEDVLHLLNHL